VRVRNLVQELRRGGFIENFNVNSKNCTELSNGTVAWIAELGRMVSQCVACSCRRRGAGLGGPAGSVRALVNADKFDV